MKIAISVIEKCNLQKQGGATLRRARHGHQRGHALLFNEVEDPKALVLRIR
jgi:hypothetical protein